MTNDEMIEVIKAESEGERIQYSTDNGMCWRDKKTQWDFYNLIYRVKPVEPIITLLDIHAYEDGFNCIPTGAVPNSLRGALSETLWTRTRVEFIELTPEVLATLTEKGILKC